MGNTSTASCECGFSKDCTFGGSRMGFKEHSTFPYYCDACGLVSANIRCEPIACPDCKSQNLIQYGCDDRKVRWPSNLWVRASFALFGTWPKSVVTIPVGNDVQRAWNKWVSKEHHLCPACRNMTLKFTSRSELYFD